MVFILLAAGLAGCERDTMAPGDPEVLTRRASADSTETDGHADSLVYIGGIAIDTAWTGETVVYY